MKVKLLETLGIFTAGTVFDLAPTLAKQIIRDGKAIKADGEAQPASKTMKPGQVLKGGLDNGH